MRWRLPIEPWRTIEVPKLEISMEPPATTTLGQGKLDGGMAGHGYGRGLADSVEKLGSESAPT